jgi:predicted ArsR family transcriptional regulator
VRTHLDQLRQAGLVVRARPRQPRGRPADAWTIAPDAQPGGRAPSAYQDLGRWLARALGSRPGGLRSIEGTGRQIGHELPTTDAPNDPDVLESTLAALGFQPTVTRREDDRLTLRLRNCPYRAAVHENQPAICALHKGITRGLLDVLLPAAKLERFEPHDPDQAGCEIDLQGIQPTTVALLVNA